jgi:hypothetical protein
MMIDSTTTFVKVIDSQTGTVGYLPVSPPIKPDSPMRFWKGRPPEVRR